MKKNAMLKIAAILMVAVLLTTCAISSTFAKYVSTPASDSATARVANWGLSITNTNSTKLFKNEYVKDTKKMALSSVAEQMILAPGTANDANNAFKVSISGTPEVAYKITATIDVELNNWKDVAGKYYCPVEFYVGNGATQNKVTAPAAGTATGIADYEAAIENAIANQFFGATMTGAAGTGDDATAQVYSDEYYPGDQDFANFGTAKDVVVTWAWPFDGDNAKDTDLGNATPKATITVRYNFTAEQLGAGSSTATDQYAK